MPRHFNDRIHESLATAALLAGGVALNVAWIDNLLITRSELIASWITISPTIGPISGVYLDTIGAFFVSYLFSAAMWRGRDVSHWRSQVFWFFFTSVVIFILMTLPFVFGFVIS